MESYSDLLKLVTGGETTWCSLITTMYLLFASPSSLHTLVGQNLA